MEFKFNTSIGELHTYIPTHGVDEHLLELKRVKQELFETGAFKSIITFLPDFHELDKIAKLRVLDELIENVEKLSKEYHEILEDYLIYKIVCGRSAPTWETPYFKNWRKRYHYERDNNPNGNFMWCVNARVEAHNRDIRRKGRR